MIDGGNANLGHFGSATGPRTRVLGIVGASAQMGTWKGWCSRFVIYKQGEKVIVANNRS
jgi:hypothetical protein